MLWLRDGLKDTSLKVNPKAKFVLSAKKVSLAINAFDVNFYAISGIDMLHALHFVARYFDIRD